jgi:hypothetical protein
VRESDTHLAGFFKYLGGFSFLCNQCVPDLKTDLEWIISTVYNINRKEATGSIYSQEQKLWVPTGTESLYKVYPKLLLLRVELKQTDPTLKKPTRARGVPYHYLFVNCLAITAHEKQKNKGKKITFVVREPHQIFILFYLFCNLTYN